MSESVSQFISQWGFFIILMIMMVVFMIVPQRKQKKKYQEMMDSMKVGSRVKTIGGIYGKIVTIKDDLVVVETGPDKTKIVFSKGAINTVDNANNTVEVSEELQ